MRAVKIALWSLLAIVSIAALAAVYLLTADLGVFKPRIERLVTDVARREFAIDGELHIDLGRQSSIVAEQVRLANADWAQEPAMISVGRLEVQMDPWSLLKGPVRVELIDIDDAVVFLTERGDGDPNWILARAEPKEPQKESAGIDLLLRQINVDTSRIVLVSPNRDRPLDIRLDRVRQRQSDERVLELDASGTLNERTIGARGEIGPWNALLSGQDVSFDVDVTLDTFEFSAEGHIDDLLHPERPALRFSAAGPDIDHLTRLLGIGEEGEGDIDLKGFLEPVENGPLQLKVAGNVGMTEIDASGTVADLRNLDNIGLDMTASGPDLGRLLRLVNIHQVGSAPFSIDIDAETTGDTFVINEANLAFADAQMNVSATMPNFPSIDDATIRLRVEGSQLERLRDLTGLPGAAKGPFSADLTVDVTDSGDELVALDLTTSLVGVRGSGQLGQPPQFFGSTFDVDAETDSIARLAGAWGMAGLPDEPAQLSATGEYVDGAIRLQRPTTVRFNRATANVDGLVRLRPGARGSGLSIAVEGPDLSEMIAAFVETDFVPEQPYALNGSLDIAADGYRLRDITGNIGTSRLAVDGLMTGNRGLNGTQFRIRSEGPAIEELVESLGDYEVFPGPYELTGDISLREDAIVLGDVALIRPRGEARLTLELDRPAAPLGVAFDVRASTPDVRDFFQGFGEFELLEQPLAIDASGRFRDGLLAVGRTEIKLGDTTVSASGELDVGSGNALTEFELNVSVPTLANVGTLDNRRMRDQGLSLNAHVAGKDGQLEVDRLDATLGDSDVRGFMRIRTGDTPKIDLDIFSDVLAYEPLFEKKELQYESKPEFEDGRLIPDIAIPFDALNSLDASIDVDIGELRRGNLFLRDIDVQAQLQESVLDVSRAAFKARSGEILAAARLDPADGAGKASLHVVARQFSLGLAPANTNAQLRFDVDMSLSSTGNDLRSLAGNANGVVFVNARGGRMRNNRFVRAIYGDLLEEILGTINPFRRTDPYTDFECIVVPLDITDGQLAGKPYSFISTNRIRIATQSSINLETESIRIGIRTTPRRALSVSAGELVNPYLEVVGTLAAPRLAVDEKGVLISGGAAVATGGLTILARGIWDRLSRSGDACGQATNRGKDALGGKFPDLTIEGAERLQ